MASPAVTGPILKLNNGVSMPSLGFGTFANEGSKGETHKAVIAALEAGYRHLDCAWFYQNEGEVGSGMREFLSNNPNVKREDIFITTKVWNHLHEPEDVEWSVKDSLAKLQTPYVDAFLVHWPIATEKNEDHSVKIGSDGKYVIKKSLTENPEPTWRAMESIYNQGLAKSIGVSNWTQKGLEALLQYAKVKPTVNQIEIHPFLPQYDLIKYCQSQDIVPVAYSPLGSQDQVPGTGEKVSTNKDLLAVAEKNGVSLAQVLIAWGLKRGYAVLPKSSNPSRIKSNAGLINLSDEDFAAVNKVAEGRNTRFVNMKDTFGYNVWPEEA
ncbi:NAD(P)-linked oxidoreductase [Glarea lozoyensis ATCC 20868]|uniref:NAD(P)-linked oxidoreductase n=2 Tax=Glarea lozoyensis TaxID=101852 RepID=S3CEZ2_GLAL2|nr:NAD(P)-linked oxidoreductase [Glarea lozoyensis ATCC 20868]EHL01328.1 putative alcohol dehydrogenase [Glarea lozoyensis 74030]EPE25067.1 NAD(P)-linked oxidoreductase [Glarea lozoyensis ATCC 20868]